jgi:3-oxoacyl-[acyl-carrier-protein] synthase II
VRLTDHHGRRRVVVTGIGVKTPAGQRIDELWSTLLAGRSVAAPITLFDAQRHSVSIACEVRGFDPSCYVNPKEARRIDRTTLLGLAAATDAIGDATGTGSCRSLGVAAHRRAVVAGSGIGGVRSFEDQMISYAHLGPDRTSPLMVPMIMTNATAALISIHHDWTGPCLAVATACASGTNAIGEGLRLVRDSLADVVVCGGTEACVSPGAMSAFARMGALSRNPVPERASRPFDVDRDGFVMGEGAAFLVLEVLAPALARGTPIYGELLGYGMSCDAHHLTAPLEDGAGAAAAIELALADAHLAASDIRHVNAHGTSTPYNDAAEAIALAKVFGEGATPVTSTKGVTGHLIGAAGAVEAVATLLTASRGIVPPTANHGLCDLPIDVVAGAPRAVGPAPGLSTSFAFGGHNAALVVGPPPCRDHSRTVD